VAVIIVLSLALVVVLVLVSAPMMGPCLALLGVGVLLLRLHPAPLRMHGRKSLAPSSLARGPPLR